MEDRRGNRSNDDIDPTTRPNATEGENDATIAPPRRLSGKTTTALLFACLAFGAVIALPLTRRLPLWIRFETALATWWLVWVVVLTRVLFLAASVDDDHVLGRFRWWFAKRRNEGPRSSPRAPRARGAPSSGPGPASKTALGAGAVAVVASTVALPHVRRKSRPREPDHSGWYDALIPDLNVGEEFGVAILVVIGLVVLVLSIWLLVEVVIPIAAFAAYALLSTMLASAARFGGRCRGRVAPSVGWALVFGTLYVAPLAGAVWIGHVLRASRAG